MRSSSNFLAVSRSEPEPDSPLVGLPPTPDHDDHSDDRLELRISVSYKTLAAVFAFFGVSTRVIDFLLDIVS